MDAAIHTTDLSKMYGRRVALRQVRLRVPENVVFGYLGPNGAGKTTTIRLLAGLLRPTSGYATVFGLDVVGQREQVQRQIGYLPGNFVAYPDLTAAQYLRYLARLRDDRDWSSTEVLAKRLELDLDLRIGAMSHGNRQKVGIVQAFAHRPRLLILDEPTSGLDPLVQREFLGLVREARAAGQTVFLSSHILSEVEAVADVVGILREGQLLVMESVIRLKARALRRVELTFSGPAPGTELAAAAGVRDVHVDANTARITVEGSTADLLRVAAPYGVDNVVSHEPDLEDIFLRYYERT